MAQNAQWELSKENILPMKTGRDVAGLNEALGEESSANWKEQRLREWRTFQDRLVANEQNKEELLNTYYDLICWLENTFPQGGKKYIKQNAKRCFHRLKDDKTFYDNWKLMTVMIKYIEASGESCRYVSETTYCDLYNYMFLNKIGTKHADFFVSWANALEASESYSQAATVFTKGLQIGAEPRKLLEKEKTLFEDRMALRTIEDMMKGENEKLPPQDQRQPLQQQGVSVPRASTTTSSEDSTVRLKVKTSSSDSSRQQSLGENARQSFSVHAGQGLEQRPGQVSAAFSAVSAPPATNVVPIKHKPDKENSQKAEQWAKPTQIPPRPSGKSSSSLKQKAACSNSFTVYCDEPDEQNPDKSTTAKRPVLLGSSVLKPRKDDDGDEGDEMIEKSANQAERGSDKKAETASQSNENVVFMFNEVALMNGPLGEMSFEELRANQYCTVEKQQPKTQDKKELQAACIALKIPNVGSEQVGIVGFLSNKDEDKDVTRRHDNEADLTMALNAEVTRRGLSKTDARMLGSTAFSDSMVIPLANDSWAGGAGNQTTETVRFDTSSSILPEPNPNQTTNKLSVTQFDCLNRILSEAFRGPSQATVAPPFGLMASDDTIPPEPSKNQSLAKQAEVINADFVPFEDSMLAQKAEPAPKPADFFAYEDSFAVKKTPAQPVRRLALQESEKKSSEVVIYEDSFAMGEKEKQPAAQKRLVLKVRSDEPPPSSSSGFIVINDGDDSSETSPQNSSDSPIQKRTKRQSCGNEQFSEGLADCSGIVADFPLAGDTIGGGGLGRLSFSTTMDLCNKQPKFCSTQYVDMNLLRPGGADFDGPEDDFVLGRPPIAASSSNSASAKRPPPKRQSITARISTMPPLQERSESSSSGGSTMAMHSALQTVRESGLSAIWESQNVGAGPVEQPPPPLMEESIALPTMNCEMQKSYHHIDIEKFVAHSQVLQQSMAFANKTYSCLREIDPTDPFSDELVERFVTKYEPSLKKLPNYIEVPGKMPDFFGPSRQSTAGKVVQLAPGFSVAYAFRVGSGAFASVVAARDVETRRLYALKFQAPACRWEFYVLSELRQRFQRKFQLPCTLDGVMDIERAFIYRDGSCYALQHVRYGPLLNLVNKSREHKIDISEPVAMYLTIELLRIIESMHQCHVIHADLKPDNVLFLGLPELPKIPRNMQGQQIIFPPKEASVRIIDFGRSIDMTLFPPGTAFLAKVATSGFDCIEMRTDRPWTYQADYFGLAGTVHVLVFLEYMRVSFRDEPGEGRWTIGKKYKRWWHHNDLWEQFFDTLLNIPDCDSQPDVKSLREAFETRFVDKMLASYAASQTSIMATMREHFHAN